MCCMSLCSKKYETVGGDPLQTKIYTLKNGLKVYMSVNKETPRIQTYIAVRSGGKNDPSDNTGLAHYLEHLMFKGSVNAGTRDYEAEKPMLEEIRQLFDIYGKTTDAAKRDSIYHRIDSVSLEASKLAIPNEYDKMMAIIGSEGSNAFTSNDVTCYIEDIPSNQVDNWARVQADRFKYMVPRGFHTELEAVYEEKNMSLVNDNEKAYETLYAALFKNHPYGTQTVIGTQDHLKNPSLTAILKQKATYYVPNNCAICLSGDFDPDQMVNVIEKYFGDWEPNPSIPEFTFKEEEPFSGPQYCNVYGLNSEFVFLGWRYPGASSKESEIAEIAGSILYNRMAGLIDLDLIQKQTVNNAFCFNDLMTDYGVLLMAGFPKEGQVLEEVAGQLTAEVGKLRSGEFDEELITAVLNNMKLEKMKALEKNSSRAMLYVDSFINGTAWEDEVGKLDRLSAVTKEDVVAWANRYLTDANLAIVYKYQGTDDSIKKIDAPKITPIQTNREENSTFLAEIQANEPEPIEPVFTDYSKDMSVFDVDGVEVLYKQNTLNDVANLIFRYDYGTLCDPSIATATSYLSYLGTPTRSAEEIAKEMYKLACIFSVSSNVTSSSISVSGLSENIGQAIGIVEDLIYNAREDNDILVNLVDDEIKSRKNSKLNQRACSRALSEYITYGPEYISKKTLSNEALTKLEPGKLLESVRALAQKQHKVLYYGPMTKEELTALLKGNHKIAQNPEPLEPIHRVKQLTPQAKVFIAPYTARQFNYIQYSDSGQGFDPACEPELTLFNEYFGGGMNSIVFQEMREARALAYSAGAYLATPSYREGTASFTASIASQNDKLAKAVEGFEEITNSMPVSDKAFQIARTSLLNQYRTKRTTGISVLFNYLDDKDLGLDKPLDEQVYNALPNLTIEDLERVSKEWVKDRTYVYGITGDPTDLDMAFLRKLGPVKVLSLEEVFGY